MSNPHIFVVEDEPALAKIVGEYLAAENMDVTILGDGTDADKIILKAAPDLVILDIMLPGQDGLEICRKVRRESNVPIIMGTAKVEELDRILGLELGADDYLCKPYSPRELMARIKAVLRRSSATVPQEPAQKLDLNEDKWEASFNGEKLDLTPQEFRLLMTLANRPGRVFSRDQLLELAFRDDADTFDRTIDSHVKNIRKKFKALNAISSPIRSVYGVGYSFEWEE